MTEEVECELEELKDMLTSNRMSSDNCNNFMTEDFYEDDYSHNQISEMQSEFMNEAEKYLKENYKGQYWIFSDWAVHIISNKLYDYFISKKYDTVFWKKC